VLYRIIENYIRDLISANGYQEVRSPQLFQRGLWEKSGHLDHYDKHIFEVGDSGLLLKPMNCPAHVQIFNANNVSYRQLPMRLAEFGCCHRNEPSGALHGIMRVRQFVQDDAHIFCSPDQIESEIRAFCELLQKVYRRFGFDDVSVALSLRPDNRAGEDALWDHSEAVLEGVLKDIGLPYKLLPGEGAFYGPKLEFSLRDQQGREWQCGTAQLDFILPERLDARYNDIDGKEHVPVMIHRAILGSFERFIGILIEHYEGKFPLWLSPVQAVVVPINADAEGYAGEVLHNLQAAGLRCEMDAKDENLMAKIKRHSLLLLPNIIVVGKREEEGRMVNLRRLGEKPVSLSMVVAISALSEEARVHK
jgi:threonyl-tRNA synthetase